MPHSSPALTLDEPASVADYTNAQGSGIIAAMDDTDGRIDGKARTRDRTDHKRGPKAAPPKAPSTGRGSRRREEIALPGGFALDESERHLMRYRRASGDSTDDGLFRVTRAIVVAGRLWRKVANDRIKSLDQTMARWETLFHVAYSDAALSQGELARLISVEGPTMVRMLDTLARDGLIEREQSTEDRRVTLNRITPAGQAAIEAIMAITNELRADVLSGIEPEKLAVTVEVLTHILRRLDAMR
ncbi:MarR family winged helix-turn-helix transcriptional regulator [Novosphingobium sp.]|uniref:MarR family winged helix-turn-helix transcriptional regulator n=1 Tax=Novosphingobium sp. TaxID=1874826 RepID=UPI002FDEA805